ncbi:MAG TPA: LirA/MavJ family T4SS effector [Paraburkholderia sp.]|uniref:LirA/MavJ family T4SS effector n=1 Tax=Paraburkholderia sp. TaxID=1926495 RepID=UPI002B4876B3|nr:LirA/MavJ family T4SS effector [Paraburkholderia sp.]HKR46543.1 LirA/MavJ family T4SS effector [Paraburkholderia sp.]
MTSVAAKDIKDEIQLRMPTFDPKSAEGMLTGKIGEYLSDAANMAQELATLNQQMESEANQRLTKLQLGALNVEQAQLDFKNRQPGVKLAPHLRNLLSTVLAQTEVRNGFNLGVKDRSHGPQQPVALTLTGFTPPDDFRGIIQDRKPFKDPTVPGGHGEFSHRIQWYCVMQAKNLTPPPRSWAEFYAWVGQYVHTTPQSTDRSSWANLGLWDALVDRNRYGRHTATPYDTAETTDFRSPENLQETISEQMTVQFPLLSTFLDVREKKRVTSSIRINPARLNDYLTKKVYGPNVTYQALSDIDKARIDNLVQNKILEAGPVIAQTPDVPGYESAFNVVANFFIAKS